MYVGIYIYIYMPFACFWADDVNDFEWLFLVSSSISSLSGCSSRSSEEEGFRFSSLHVSNKFEIN